MTQSAVVDESESLFLEKDPNEDRMIREDIENKGDKEKPMVLDESSLNDQLGQYQNSATGAPQSGPDMVSSMDLQMPVTHADTLPSQNHGLMPTGTAPDSSGQGTRNEAIALSDGDDDVLVLTNLSSVHPAVQEQWARQKFVTDRFVPVREPGQQVKLEAQETQSTQVIIGGPDFWQNNTLQQPVIEQPAPQQSQPDPKTAAGRDEIRRRMREARKPVSGAGAIFGGKVHEQRSPSEAPRHILDSFPTSGQEDTSWMSEDGTDGIAEADRLTAEVNSIHALKTSNGSLTKEEEIQLISIQKKLKALQSRSKPRAPRRPRMTARESAPGQSSSDRDEEEEKQKRIQKYKVRNDKHHKRVLEHHGMDLPPTKKPRRKAAKDAREYAQQQREIREEKEAARMAKQISQNTSNQIPGRGRGRGKAQLGRQLQDPANGRNQMKVLVDADRMCSTMLQGLTYYNALEIGRSNQRFGPAQSISTKNKEAQLRELLGGIPDDYDTHKAKIDKRDLKEASKRFGKGMVTAKNGRWLFRGMISPLLHHQLVAADFMVARELGEDRPHGGINADAMGLGKTVEMLATMVGNPPTPGEKASGLGATLLVVPASVVSQWENEIRNHCKPGVFMKTQVYKRSSKICKEVLETCDIVITTYQELQNSIPILTDQVEPVAGETEEQLEKRKKDLKKQRNKEKKRLASLTLPQLMKELAPVFGPLHKVRWYRIVLDEAHAIKNYESSTAIASHVLDAQFRWALSATPIQNSLEEFFSYFRFLRAPWTRTFDDFMKHFGNPDEAQSSKRITIVLSLVMLRRTMKDQILGRPIVQLPTPHPETIYVPLSNEETIVYRLIEGKVRQMINKSLEDNSGEKTYCNILVMLLRLRQAASHPFLLENWFRDILDIQDLIKLKKRLKACQSKIPVYQQIEQWCATDGEKPQKFGESDLGRHYNMGKFLDGLDEKGLLAKIVCRICGDHVTTAVITSCSHIFCRDCLEKEVHKQATTFETPLPECPTCDAPIVTYNPYTKLDLHGEDRGEVLINEQSDTDPQRKQRRVDMDTQLTKGSTWMKKVIAGEAELVLSAKMIALKAKILKWQKEAPNDKILGKSCICARNEGLANESSVFTQFRLNARIMSEICKENKWPWVYFNVSRRFLSVLGRYAGSKSVGRLIRLLSMPKCDAHHQHAAPVPS
jgi:SNF2 family DNA or RNA helicase